MTSIQKLKLWTCQEDGGLKLKERLKENGKWLEVRRGWGDAKWERGKERGNEEGGMSSLPLFLDESG